MVLENPRAATFTAVSNVFLDHYMPEANGEFVKVYLYLLRLSGMPDAQISILTLADQLNHTEKDVLRALRYWEKQGLLQILEENGEMKGLRLLPMEGTRETGVQETPAVRGITPEPAPAAEGSVPIQAPEFPAAGSRVAAVPKSASVTEETLRRLQSDDEFRQILFVAEQYLGRTLSPKDVRLLGYLYEDLRFPEDLIEYLIEYCVGGGHRSTRYIESVALGWHEEGITTREQAREIHRAYSRENRQVMRAFGIAGRVLTPEERTFVERWLKEYGMPLEVVTEACARTMSAIHKPSFEYTDSILSAWRDAGVRTLPAAKAQAEAHRIRRRPAGTPEKKAGARQGLRNYEQRETDYDALLAQGKLGG